MGGNRPIAFYVTSAGNTIRGLSITGWRTAIFIDGGAASGNRVLGNWLGFDRLGTPVSGTNFQLVLNNGAHDNIIGTPNLADRNVSGQAVHAIENYGPGVDRNIIQDNLLCMRPNGTQTASCSTGIDHNFGPKASLIGGTGPNERNIIGATGLQGIEFSHGWNPSLSSATGGTLEYQINDHRVIGNWVGFPGSGHYNVNFISGQGNPNGSDNGQAINVYDGSNNNLVEGNYIASRFDGIQFMSANASGNIARGNFIGISPFGEAAPMAWWGYHSRLGAHDEVVEGLRAAARRQRRRAERHQVGEAA